MKIVICIKSVLKSALEGAPRRTLWTSELNPYDRPALALGVKLASQSHGTVTALTMGPAEPGGDALRHALALGADRGVLVSDPAIAGSDTLATSTVLAAALKKLMPFDLVLFGLRSSDSDTGHVGPQTADLLSLPLVAYAMTVSLSEAGLMVERRVDGFREKYEVALPAVLTVRPTPGEMVDISLAALQYAYTEGYYETWTLADLGLSPAEAGLAGSATRLGKLEKRTRERRCEFLTGSGTEMADSLVRRLEELGRLL